MSQKITIGNIGLSQTNVQSFVSNCAIEQFNADSFSKNKNITEISISSVNCQLPDGMFAGCTKLSSLQLPSLTKIDNRIFGKTKRTCPANLKRVLFSDCTQDIGCILSGLTRLEEIHLPAQLSILSANALTDVKKLTTLNVPRNAIVEDTAFQTLVSLTDMSCRISADNENLGLRSLPKLTNVTIVSPDNSLYSLNTTVLADLGISSLTFENGAMNLTHIVSGALSGLPNIHSLDFSNALMTTLPTNAFALDTNLSTIYLNANYVRSIETSAFAGIPHINVVGNQNLQSIEYPGAEVEYQSHFSRNVIAIGPSAFYKAGFSGPVEMITLSTGDSAFENSTISAVFLQFGKSNQDSLKPYTFAHCRQLQTAFVTQISSIDDFCFYECAQLQNFNIDLPFGAKAYAFAGCVNLSAFPIDKLRFAGEYAFAQCSSMFNQLENVDLQRIQEFDKYAFDSALTCNTLTLNGNTLVDDLIADRAFCNCRVSTVRLIGISLSNLQSIQKYAGNDLIALHSKLKAAFGILNDPQFELDDAVIRKDGRGNTFECLVTEDGVLKMIDTTAKDYRQFISDPIIPFHISAIDANVFSGFSADLSSIDLNNVVSASDHSFENCSHLSIVIAPALQHIGENAFSNCSALRQFDFSKVQSISQNAFSRCISLPEVVGENIATVGECAFLSCTALQNVICPDILDVKQMAFAGCINLTAVNFADSNLEILDKCSFIGCTEMQSMLLGNKMQLIDEWALKDTSPNLCVIFNDMHPIDMLDVVKEDNICGSSIGAKFGICQNGRNRILLQTIQDDELFRVQDNVKNAMLFKSIGAANIFDVQNGVLVGIKDENVTDTDVTLDGNAISVIASYAFTTTRKLTSIYINPDISLSIQSKAFEHNMSLKEIRMGANVKTIASDAFTRCAVEKVTLPPLASVGNYGLNRSYALSSLTFSAGTRGISPSALIDCGPVLTDISLPTTINTIGKYAFAETNSNFPNISNLPLGELTNLTSIEDFAFYNALQSTPDDVLNIPSKVTMVGAAAFGYNEDTWAFSISAFNAPQTAYGNNVQDIGPSAFIFNGFRDVYFNTNVPALTSIGDYAFAYPKKKFSIRIPKTIKHIGKNAFKKNIILNSEYVNKNSISIDLSTVTQILNVIDSVPSADFTAENTIGVTDHTCLLATGIGASADQNFLYALDGKLNLCPTMMRIDIQNRKLLSIVDKSIISSLIPKYVTTVGPAAYKDCTKVTSISALNADVQFQASALYNCSSLTAINGPEKFFIDNVEPYAFYNCQNLMNIKVLSTATHISECAFYNCGALTSIQDEDAYDYLDYWTLTSIGPSAFMQCSGIKAFSIPRTITAIGAHAFDGCLALDRLRIDLTTVQFKTQLSTDSEIGSFIHALFNGIRPDALCEIVFNDITYMNDGNVKLDDRIVGFRIMADDTRAISSVDEFELQESGQDYLNLSSVTQVDNFAFRNINDLRMINILPSETVHLMSIGDFAFSKCSDLQYVNGNMLSCASIGSHAFDSCINMTALQIDLKQLNAIGRGAFAKSGLKKLVFYVDEDLSERDEPTILAQIKAKIGFDAQHNLNPMLLPEDCVVEVINKKGTRIALFDCQLNSLMHTDIDINRNQMVFIDKNYKSIKPLLLVKPAHENQLPTIAKNEFHVNIIGRWK